MSSNPVPTDKENILVVDDTPDNVRLLSTLLTSKGYQVRKALNGQRAMLTVQQSLPDLILLDIMMPEMDGYQVCRKLKADEATRDIPIIFISALDDAFDKVKAFEIGAVDYITKPFQSAEVLARIQNQLTIRNQQKQLLAQQQQLQAQNARLKEEIKARQKIEEALRAEQEKSERLLRNILPEAIVAQLKQDESAIAEQFDEVTVLFADLVNFTYLAASMTPKELVELLNQIFSIFDQLTEQHGLEKIKTIGDAYMVVGGLPVPRDDHAEAIADMALNMQCEITHFKPNLSEPFQIRIGIHSGPVVAGAIGTKKFIYDLWGDTVNVASRMESTGIPGQIQVTSATYERLKDKYVFENRGAIAVKGKGEMITYWLKERKIG